MDQAVRLLYPRMMVAMLALLPVLNGLAAAPSSAPAPEVLFRDVRVFDGTSGALSGPTEVLVRGNTIGAVGAGAIPTNPVVTVIDGRGRTLMPGLIDAHTHIMFETLTQEAILTSDLAFVTAVAVKGASDMLMRGFTSIRDLGGPALGLKRAIDQGFVPGPRIWPSGAMISKTGGHGDFRLPNELPAPPGNFSLAIQQPTGCAGFGSVSGACDQVSERGPSGATSRSRATQSRMRLDRAGSYSRSGAGSSAKLAMNRPVRSIAGADSPRA